MVMITEGRSLPTRSRLSPAPGTALQAGKREAVYIRRSQKNILNGMSEWHQPALNRVKQEIENG